MSRKTVNVRDFGLFHEVVKAAVKVVESAKFVIGPGGLEIYGARPNRSARCEMTSNAVDAEEQLEFSVEKLAQFLRVVQTVKDVHEGDYSGLKFAVDLPFVRFESKKFRTKYSTCSEALIKDWVSTKVTAQLTPVFEFTTNSEMIKRLNSHLFMFNDPKDARVYLETRDDMENNAVFATLGNRETDLNNEITFKLGLANSGSLKSPDGSPRKVILDIERLNYFNAIPSDSIRVSLMSVNCLVSRTRLTGSADGAFFAMSVYGTLLKN